MVDITSLAIREETEELIVSAQISMPGRSGEAWYRLPKEAKTDLEGATDAFFIIGLILALGTDQTLTIDQPVSKCLIYNARPIQDILTSWYPSRLKPITKLEVPTRKQDRPRIQDRTVTCFTGGADSFDTFINNQDEIDALLYVHGFDVSLSRAEVRQTTSEHLQDVADMTSKELIEVSTNIRSFLNLAGKWPLVTHGASLSAVGHLLSGRYGRLLIPASHTYQETYPWGSHPLLDHWYSSNRFPIVHDGAGSTRVQKTLNLANNPVAQKHLRVCWQNTGKYNCGVCGKCTRTMIALQLAGVLPKFETFDSQVDLDAARALKINGRSDRTYVAENLAFAEQQNDEQIATVLRENLAEYDTKMRKKKSGKKQQKVATDVAFERRLSSVEASVEKLQGLWPIRTWVRFAHWRRFHSQRK